MELDYQNLKHILQYYTDLGIKQLVEPNNSSKYLDSKQNCQLLKLIELIQKQNKSLETNNITQLHNLQNDIKQNNIKQNNLTTENAIYNSQAVDEAEKLIENVNDFKQLIDIIQNFSACDLKEITNATIIYTGNLKPKLLVITEAPEKEDDISKTGFVGKNTILLKNIIASIKADIQHNTMILNSIFWYPPANQSPPEYAINICRPFIEKIIQLIKPQKIICFGNASQYSLFPHTKKQNIHKIIAKNYTSTIDQKNIPCYLAPALTEILLSPTLKQKFWKQMFSYFKNLIIK